MAQAAVGRGWWGSCLQKHLQGCLWVKLRLRIWQNSSSVKTCTPLHHSPTRNSPSRTTSDILKHLQIFRDGAMSRKDDHTLNHHHLDALDLRERCLRKTTVAHVWLPETSACKTFPGLLFQITLRTEDRIRRAEDPRVISSFLDRKGRKCRLFQRWFAIYLFLT